MPVNVQASRKKVYAKQNVTIIPMNKEMSLRDQRLIIDNCIIKTIGIAKTFLLKRGLHLLMVRESILCQVGSTCILIDFMNKVRIRILARRN